MATGLVDPSDLAGSFERAAAGAGFTVHRGIDDDVLARLVKEYEVDKAVISSEPVVLALVERLRVLDVTVVTEGEVEVEDPVEDAIGGAADLLVTAARAAVASTGAVALDSPLAGIAARVQLCLVPTTALVATSTDLLRPFTNQRAASAGRLVVITGPGPEGPSAVHVALLD